MRQPIQYPGGKAKLAPLIIDRLCLTPESVYIEPFVGAGGVASAVMCSDSPPAELHLSDTSEPIMTLWSAIYADPEGVANAMQELAKRPESDRDLYFAVREELNNGAFDSAASQAARVMYLSRNGFSGLWRVNRQGRHNVPWNKQPRVITPRDDVTRWHDELHRAPVVLRCEDWRAAMRRAASFGARAVVYLDPPYDGGWVGYTPGGWCTEELDLLCCAARSLARDHGARVVMNNADTRTVRDLLDRWRATAAEQICAGRAIGNHAGRAARAEEVIAVWAERGLGEFGK